MWPIACSWAETEAAPALPLAGQGASARSRERHFNFTLICTSKFTSNVIFYKIIIFQAGNNESTACDVFSLEQMFGRNVNLF